MQVRNPGLALVLLTALAVPSFVRAQGAGDIAQSQRAQWATPDQLVAHREALKLTPGQVRELSFLSTQLRRYQEGLLRSPSKPWIAGTFGTTPDEAARQAVALLSADQRALAPSLRPPAAREAESV